MLSKKKLLGDYHIGKTIGQGAFSKVKIGYHKATNQKVAIKVIDKKLIKEKAEQAKQAQEERERRRLKKEGGQRKPEPKKPDPQPKSDAPSFISELQLEVQLLMRLDHPNIIRLYQVMDTEEECYVVMEYAAGGELLDHITSRGRLSEAEARKYFRQLISAMDHCHMANVVHRDLKLENLLLNSENNLLLSDFGLGRTFRSDQEELMKTFCGTPNYAAVELISGIPYVGVKSDIWAMGIVLYIMTTGHPPFTGQSISALYSKIKAIDYKCPDYFSKDLVKVIARMLTKDPQKRISMEELREDAWVNFEEIQRPLSIEPKVIGNPDPSQISQFIVGITNDKNAIIYTLHSHMESRHLNPTSPLGSSTLGRPSSVKRPSKVERPVVNQSEEDDVSPLPLEKSHSNKPARTVTANGNPPLRRRNTITDFSSNPPNSPPILAPLSLPSTDAQPAANPKPRGRSMSIGARPQSMVATDKSTGAATPDRDTRVLRRMSMVGPVPGPGEAAESSDQGPRPGTLSMNRRASLAIPSTPKHDTSALPAPSPLIRTPSTVVDDLDPFNGDDFDLEPTKEEIEDWHVFHRPAKEVRTVRFSFNASTTSPLPPALIFQELHRVLVDLNNKKYQNLKMRRIEDYYMLHCSVTAFGESDPISFELEVCKVWLLKIHGVRVKRISGNPFTYKSIYQEITDALQIQ